MDENEDLANPGEDAGGNGSPPREPVSLGRRALILGAAGSAGVAALLAGAEPAGAANGGSVLLGKANTATATTSITTDSGYGLEASSSEADMAALYGVDKATTGGHGVLGTSTHSIGVKGNSTDDIGVSGYTAGDGKPGVEGVDTSTGGGNGVLGASTHGTGVYGTSSSTSGVTGRSTGGSSYGGVVGLLGTSLPADGVPILGGVVGYALFDQLAQTGVIGYSHYGTGVYGQTDDGFAFGTVAVSAYDNSSGGAYGLYASSAKGQAVYANGNATVTGSLAKGGGSFRIDHPVDPSDKYLYHSFVESPDMMNVYNGNVVLDGAGKAVVELPDWFEALNKEFRYQLTPIGAFAPLYVSQEIAAGQFGIGGGNPGQKVSWQVTGIRQDAWANANRIPVEVEKPAEDRGRYLHPELFGPGAEPVSELVRARPPLSA